MFISIVPLIPNRICSTRIRKAPDGIPNIIYTGRERAIQACFITAIVRLSWVLVQSEEGLVERDYRRVMTGR